MAPSSFLRRGSEEWGVDPFSLYPVTEHMGMAQSCTRGGSDWTLEAFFYWEDGQTLEQAS